MKPNSTNCELRLIQLQLEIATQELNQLQTPKTSPSFPFKLVINSLIIALIVNLLFPLSTQATSPINSGFDAAGFDLITGSRQ